MIKSRVKGGAWSRNSELQGERRRNPRSKARTTKKNLPIGKRRKYEWVSGGSPFFSAEFFAANSHLSSSTATGPDKVGYPMLKHLSRFGMDLLHIFNLSLSLYSFLSFWKTSSIIPIHNIRKPLNSPASFRPISFISCVSKLFNRIILSRLFFLESNSILSPRQAGFQPGRSILDQILFLSQPISDGFNKLRPGSRTILATIDFSKVFGSVRHPTLFRKLISAGLPPCFAL